MLNTDVVVIGGGPAGCAAAIAAARNGIKVVLVERYAIVGGMATVGGVQLFLQYNDNKGNLVIGGIPLEIVNRMRQVGGLLGDFRKDVGLSFDKEMLQTVLLKLLNETEVIKKFQSVFCKAIVKESTIDTIIVWNKSGFQAIKGKIFIDATGDADVAFLSGVPCRKGWSQNRKLLQAGTLCFRMGNVNFDEYKAVSWEKFQQLYKEALARGEFPVQNAENLRFQSGVSKLPIKGQVFINISRVRVDGIDNDSLTQSYLLARNQNLFIANFYRKYVPGFRNSYIIDMAVNLGIRETRRIRGEYTLTKDDFLKARHFKDAIARCAYPIDIHNPQGQGIEYHFLKKGTYYTIPYRSLIPQKVENLIVAGRCISGTYEAMGSYRVMPVCMAMGQAAGTAASLCIKNHLIPLKLDVNLLRDNLMKDKALV
ncbi:FAD-dependent oxidoreductase [bacterium]|nr:FAD-dependent oxidoreductase [bacterium]